LGVLILLTSGLIPIAYLFAPVMMRPDQVASGQHGSGGASGFGLLTNSVVVGGLTTLLALIWGMTFGLAVAPLQRRLRSALVAASLVPLVIPPFVQAVAWIEILNWGGSPPFASHGLLAPLGLSADAAAIVEASWVLSLSLYPVVAWAVLVGQSRKSRELIDDARLHVDEGGVLRHVALPMIAPSIVAGAALVFF
jgi:iron(III) transport system permease protein